MPIGRLSPSQAVYQSSGESTPAAKLPDQFKATPQPASPIAAQLSVPPEWLPDIKRSPVVTRVPRMVGIWHLYARGARRQPYERVGTPGGNPQRPYISAFQPNDMGPIRNGGFNNALYQAGYPGFNLGLSFKVQTLPTMGGPRTNMSRGGPGNRAASAAVNVFNRPSGAPRVR
jgi:hypothetical protein